MRVLIKPCESLSAVIRALAQAYALHEAGHTVFVEVLPRFHDLFRCVGYCKPANPFTKSPEVDEVHAPCMTELFDAPPLSTAPWFDNDHYRLERRPVVSVYGVGWDPGCIETVKSIMDQTKEFRNRPHYILTQDQNLWDDGVHICPLRLRDLPGLIAHASEFVAPPSAALSIAYSVRPNDTTYTLLDLNEILPV